MAGEWDPSCDVRSGVESGGARNITNRIEPDRTRHRVRLRIKNAQGSESEQTFRGARRDYHAFWCMPNKKRVVFGVIVLVAMVMSMCYGQTMWGQDPFDSLRKASPKLAKIVPPLPTPASFVADVPNVVSPEMQDVIDSRIRSAQQERLGDIAAAILPDIGDRAPSDVALAIYRTWRVGALATIGERERDLGALILLVPKELAPNKRGECFILTGRGMEGIITDGTAAAICRDGVVPFMKQRDYASALLAAIDSITRRVRANAGFAGPSAVAESAVAMSVDSFEARQFVPSGGGGSDPWMVTGITFGALALAGAGARGVAVHRRKKPRKCAKCGTLMQRLTEIADDSHLSEPQQLEEKLGSIDYDVWQCSCGETMLPLAYRKWLSSYHECPDCHARTLKTTRKTIRAATYSSSGLAEKTHHCESCKKTRKERVTLPQLTRSSSSGGSSSSGSSGSSFGGSGSSSGGGGGSSY